MLTVYYARSNDPLSALIRLRNWSRWSHVAVGTDEGTVIEAVWPRVREVPLATFLANNRVVEAEQRFCANDHDALTFLRLQVGKLYDLGAWIWFLVPCRDWSSPNRWDCAELTATAFAVGGTPWFRKGFLSRVTPGTIYMLANPAEEK